MLRLPKHDRLEHGRLETVVPADASHLGAIEQLLQHGRHFYSSQPDAVMGAALAEILARQGSVVGIANTVGRGEAQVWGFAALEREVRPTTLDSAAPSRLYIAHFALANGRSPYDDVPILVAALVEIEKRRSSQASKQSNEANPSLQLIYYGHQPWLIKPLERAGFTITERVEFLVLQDLQRRTFPTHNSALYPMRIAQRSDLEAIAALDAQAFSALWHIGVDQLMAMWAGEHRIAVAYDGETIVGYTAMAQLVEEGYGGGRYAHLSRIATAPRVRGQGVGRALLLEVIQFAQKQGSQQVTLNTQTDNDAASALYRSMGFSKSGQRYPVLTKIVDFQHTV